MLKENIIEKIKDILQTACPGSTIQRVYLNSNEKHNPLYGVIEGSLSVGQKDVFQHDQYYYKLSEASLHIYYVGHDGYELVYIPLENLLRVGEKIQEFWSMLNLLKNT